MALEKLYSVEEVAEMTAVTTRTISELVSICTVADVACTKEQAKAMSKTLCELWKQADIRGITFRYDYLEDSEAARFTLVAPLTLTENALAVLHQNN